MEADEGGRVTVSALGLQQQGPHWRHHLQTEATLCVCHWGLLNHHMIGERRSHDVT